METVVKDVLLQLTWPAAMTAVAFSPLAKALGSWLAGRNGNDGSRDRLAEAMDRLASAQDRQAQVLQQMQTAMALLLDRTSPRGD